MKHPVNFIRNFNEIQDELDITEVFQKIKDGEFEDVNSFLAHPAFAGLTDPLDANDFTVSSNYFLMKGRVTLGDRVVQLYSVLWRDPKDGKTRVIARDLSKRFKPTKELIPL